MNPTVRPRRDFSALEARRFVAAELFRQGNDQAAVVHRLHVSRQTASRWHDAWRRHGRAALKAAGRAGRRPRLDDVALQRVEAVLLRGPKSAGFSTDLWTLPRISRIIARTSGIQYHPGHVWKLLRRMGWSRQRPARRAKEQDPAVTARWLKHRWPVVKKTQNAETLG